MTPVAVSCSCVQVMSTTNITRQVRRLSRSDVAVYPSTCMLNVLHGVGNVKYIVSAFSCFVTDVLFNFVALQAKHVLLAAP